MGLITRFYGPNKKGSELTIKDMDDNLYFLQSKGVESVSFSSNTLTLTNPTGGTLTTTINTSQFDTFVTGGTYNNGIITFTNNSGNTFNVTGITTSTNLGDILYVSENGDDNTAEKGNLHKPWRNLYAAKSASTSGDTVYVLPGTWTYDNTNSEGNPYNGQVDTLVNLWKDGVTYYFSPNTKIEFFNETTAGAAMYLFSPESTTGETCTVLGHLEYEQTGLGADTSNGANFFYYNNNSNCDGSTFYAEVKKIISHHCPTLYLEERSVSNPTNLTVISEEEYWDYLGGQTQSGSFYLFRGNGGEANINIYSKYREYRSDRAYAFYVRSNCSNFNLNISGEKAISERQLIRSLSVIGTFNVNIEDVYYGNSYTPFAELGAVMTNYGNGGGEHTVNINANLYDLRENSLTSGLFHFTNNATNVNLNYKGNITTNTSTGNGRFIVTVGTNASNINSNINGDINFVGTGTTTRSLFEGYGTNTKINYSGKISGNFASGIARPRNGSIININNSFIESEVDGATSSVFVNNSTSLGTGRLNNSYVRLTNNTNGVVDGEDNNIFINNSTIINLGTGSTISFNTTNNGDLQILNSTLISSYSGATSILYNGTTSVISSNTTVSSPYTITDLKGSIITLTDLTT